MCAEIADRFPLLDDESLVDYLFRLLEWRPGQLDSLAAVCDDQEHIAWVASLCEMLLKSNCDELQADALDAEARIAALPPDDRRRQVLCRANQYLAAQEVRRADYIDVSAVSPAQRARLDRFKARARAELRALELERPL